MTGSRRFLAALGMLLVLALAGCVRFQADLSVDEANLLDGDIVVAVITNDEPGSADKARDAAADIEERLLPILRGSDGVTAEPYEQDDYVGTRFTLDNTPFEVFSGSQNSDSLVLMRAGDRFLFSGLLDFTPGDEPSDDAVEGDPADADIRVSMHFPGEVYEHNGDLDGTTVTWTTTLEGSIEMRAAASAIPAPVPVAQVILIVGAVLIGLALIVVAIVLIRRRRAAPSSGASTRTV